LADALSRTRNVDPNDVKFVKLALNRIGYYDMPEHGNTNYLDTALFTGIEKFQKKFGLAVDGVIKPDGETEKVLAAKSPIY